ncbi:kinase-like protein [Trametes punicea]|nr:kinase-like protein [Trametes punicea]
MAPLRRQRLQRAQSSVPYRNRASGMASATQSIIEPLARRHAKSTATSLDNVEVTHIGPESTQTNLATAYLNRRPRPLALIDVEATKTIGVGGWGAVHVARVRRDTSSHPVEQRGASFALKVIGKNILRDLERNDRRPDRAHAAEMKNAERRILSSLPWNPFVAGLVDVHIDMKNVYLSMELATCGTLYSQFQAPPGLSDREVKFYFANIVLALEFLHTQGIVHCDVKPENLVLGADGYLMLTDFGLAQPLHGGDKWNRMGTLEYMSPEMVSGEPMDTVEKRLAADWWAAAVCLFEMKTQTHPFDCGSDDPQELMDKHMSEPLRWPPHLCIGEEFEDLLSRMLSASLEHRYGARDVPEGKGGAFVNKDIREHRYMQTVNWDRISMRVAAAPRVPKPSPELSSQRHRKPFLEQRKVPCLPIKRPSPRLEYLEIKLEKEDCPRKKRRMAGELSMCLQPSEPSVAAQQGNTGVEG